MQINFVVSLDPALLSLAKKGITLLSDISAKESMIMTTLQEDVDAIAAQTTAMASLTTFIQGLMARLAAIPGLTPEQQTKIDAIGAGLMANTASINAALAMGVPPAPPPTTVPPVV